MNNPVTDLRQFLQLQVLVKSAYVNSVRYMQTFLESCKWSLRKDTETIACCGNQLLRRRILEPSKFLDLHSLRSKALGHWDCLKLQLLHRIGAKAKYRDCLLLFSYSSLCLHLDSCYQKTQHFFEVIKFKLFRNLILEKTMFH